MKEEIKVEVITPTYAAELLKMNTNNRAVRQSKVDLLAESMKKGEWELSNDAIVISDGNVLLNGQHRLMAVVKSGMSCAFIIYKGAADRTFEIMDTPSLRSLADVVKHKGCANQNNTAAAVNKLSMLLADHECGYETILRFSRSITNTRRELVEIYDLYKNDIDFWLNKCLRLYNKELPIVPPSTLAALGVFLTRILFHSEDNILAFFKELLVDGACKNTTVLYVRKKLIRHKMKTETIRQGDMLRYIIRAWNDFILGKQVLLIKVNEDAFRYIRPI